MTDTIYLKLKTMKIYGLQAENFLLNVTGQEHGPTTVVLTSQQVWMTKYG